MWGWVSLMLADVQIHPLVIAQAALLPHDSPAGGSPRLGHIMVEAGLDAWCRRHWRRARSMRLSHTLDEKSAGFVADALDDVYDLDLKPTPRGRPAPQRDALVWGVPAAGEPDRECARRRGARCGCGPARMVVGRATGIQSPSRLMMAEA